MQSPCHLCAGSPPTNESTRLCAVCSRPALFICMLRRFKESDSDHLRNGVDWLLDFLEFSSLHYVCSLCSKINCGKGNASTQELSVMKQSIEDLGRKVANILKVVQISADVAPDASKGTEVSSYPPISLKKHIRCQCENR